MKGGQLSRFMSLVLRHKPETIGITLGKNGWVPVKDLLHKLEASGWEVTLEHLQQMVKNNNKQRFSFNEDSSMIRANQGHSVKIDLGLKAVEPPEILYHGTASRFLKSILKSGIQKRQRHHVHLSLDNKTALAVGKRHGRPIILKIKAKEMWQQGSKFYLSENGVWLTEHIPIEYFIESIEFRD